MKLVSGGYLICKPIRLGDTHPLHNRFESVRSGSTCLTEQFPSFELHGGTEESDESIVAAYPDQFTNTADLLRVRDLLSAMRADGRLEYPGTFTTLSAAREYLTNLHNVGGLLTLLGLSLSEQHAAAMLTDEPSPNGCIAMLSRNLAPQRGNVLGWEVLGDDFNGFHSWYCNGIEADAEKWGIVPNQFGFIDSFEDAVRVAEHCNHPDTGAEPCDWAPWLVQQYPLAIDEPQREA